jgi:hypothetical protein
MTAFVLTSAADKDALGAWTAGGGAASLLDGIQTNDAKYALFDAGADESHILRIGVTAPAGMPSSVDIVVRHVIDTGSPVLSFIDLHDAAGTVLFQLFPGQAVPGVEADETFGLTQVYGGVPDISGDWHLELTYYASPSGASARVDQVSGTYDGAGGGGGTGPGGQTGVNAAIMIPCGMGL